jgi:membrane protein YdbS with pleckstrin-like domain
MSADKVFNQDTYPVENKWMIKSFIYLAFQVIFIGIFGYFIFQRDGKRDNAFLVGYLTFLGICQLAIFIMLILRKNRFRYEFQKDNIIVKQGVLEKLEKRVLYGRIQNIKINQDVFDNFLGIATLTIETASEAGGASISTRKGGWASIYTGKRRGDISTSLGSHANNITIPGLSYQDALELNNFLKEKIKCNPIDDAQSGL